MNGGEDFMSTISSDKSNTQDLQDLTESYRKRRQQVQEEGEARDGWFGKWPGVVRPALAWQTELMSETLPLPPLAAN